MRSVRRSLYSSAARDHSFEVRLEEYRQCSEDWRHRDKYVQDKFFQSTVLFTLLGAVATIVAVFVRREPAGAGPGPDSDTVRFAWSLLSALGFLGVLHTFVTLLSVVKDAHFRDGTEVLLAFLGRRLGWGPPEVEAVAERPAAPRAVFRCLLSEVLLSTGVPVPNALSRRDSSCEGERGWPECGEEPRLCLRDWAEDLFSPSKGTDMSDKRLEKHGDMPVFLRRAKIAERHAYPLGLWAPVQRALSRGHTFQWVVRSYVVIELLFSGLTVYFIVQAIQVPG